MTRKHIPRTRIMLAVVACLLWAGIVVGQEQSAPNGPWAGTWASSPQLAAASDLPPNFALNDSTIRQVVFTSIGGKRIRVRLSNAFGTSSLTVSSVHVAMSAGAGAIKPATDRELTFNGRPRVTIPAGALMISAAG